jgi:hypothetical protein
VDVLSGIWNGIATLGMQTMMSVGSALLAVVSAFLSWRMSRRSEKRANVSLKMAYDSDIIRWSDEVILTFAQANEILFEKGVSYPDQDFARRRSEARAQLSALIDRGRMFFPNTKSLSGHGAEKEIGFQGHRQPVLNELVNAYSLLDQAGSAPGPDQAACEALMKHRRAFIAEVFRAVDPERRGSTLKEFGA